MDNDKVCDHLEKIADLELSVAGEYQELGLLGMAAQHTERSALIRLTSVIGRSMPDGMLLDMMKDKLSEKGGAGKPDLHLVDK